MSVSFSVAARASIAVLFLAASAASVADRTFSTLEERMTGQEFRDTGLYKLNDEELAALNRWIRQRTLAEEDIERDLAREGSGRGPEATVGDRRGFGAPKQDRRPIQSRMIGEFPALLGDTVFELENGMVWRQTDGRRFDFPRTLNNPEIEIKPGAFGSWQMVVEGYNRRVGVERVR